MSSDGTRTRSVREDRTGGKSISFSQWVEQGGNLSAPPPTSVVCGKQITVSESHPKDRKTGTYREGGPFYTSQVRNFVEGPVMSNLRMKSQSKIYSGILHAPSPTLEEMANLGYNTKEEFGDENKSSMTSDGTTAIANCSPTNPASDLGTSLAEAFREGVPSLPGIQSWERRTEALKALGSEYLNYQFGWAPLAGEVESVRDTARQHRDLLLQYHRGEGSDTHRTFRFPSQPTTTSLKLNSNWGQWPNFPVEWFGNGHHGTRQVFRKSETKRWFEGVFTYGLPSSTDSWRKALGYGSDADALYGLALTPSVLWELTPWSWAVDWFSNAGDVITNVTNFGLAGLVMRYGYMMEESIDEVYAEGVLPDFEVASLRKSKTGENVFEFNPVLPGNYKCGSITITKRRIPASPFGFSVGWEDLSPTQLAITAALGITRLL